MMRQEKKEIKPDKIALKVIDYFYYVNHGYSNSMARSIAKIRTWEHNWLMDTNATYIRIHISKRQGFARGKDHAKQLKRLHELENPHLQNLVTIPKGEITLPVGYRNNYY